MQSILIGIGHLTWEMVERQSGRYGTIYLSPPTESGDGESSSQGAGSNIFVKMPSDISGYGRITAKVLSPRESNHVGDRIRGFYPSLPNEGEQIVLGEGMAYYDKGINDVACFGVQPLNGRKQFWMSPENLFKCHSSVVELTWEPLEVPTEVVMAEPESDDVTITVVSYPGEGFCQIAHG